MLIVTAVVIGLGGIIRIYDAGESCPDWPTCFGTWGFEVSEEEQGDWWEENPDEVDSRGSGHRYTTFQIFTEWFHRLLAGAILGPLVLINWYLIRKSEDSEGEVLLASTISAVLIIWQGAVGWLTVEMDNLHWSVALHLSSALLFTMSLVWLWISICRAGGGLPKWICFDVGVSAKWRLRILLLSLGAFISIFSGTFVSTTPGANSGCGVSGFPDSWPLCHGEFVQPIDDLVAQSKMIHRWIVGIVWTSLIVASYFAWKDWKDCPGEIIFPWIWASAGIFTANVAVGATYILTWDMEEGFFEFLSLVHLMLASLTFLALATTWVGCSISNDEVV